MPLFKPGDLVSVVYRATPRYTPAGWLKSDGESNLVNWNITPGELGICITTTPRLNSWDGNVSEWVLVLFWEGYGWVDSKVLVAA